MLYHRNQYNIVKIQKKKIHTKIQLNNVNEMMIDHYLPFTTVVVV